MAAFNETLLCPLALEFFPRSSVSTQALLGEDSKEVPFEAESLPANSSQNFDQIQVSAFIVILCKKEVLCPRGALIYEYKNENLKAV